MIFESSNIIFETIPKNIHDFVQGGVYKVQKGSRYYVQKGSLYKVHWSISKNLWYIGQKWLYLIDAPCKNARNFNFNIWSVF